MPRSSSRSSLTVACSLWCLAGLLGPGCGGPDRTAPLTTPTPGSPDPTPAPGTGGPPPATPVGLDPPTGVRLPDTARPLRYRLALEVDAAQPTFRGRVEIDVSVARSTSVLWLNAQDLTIRSATFRQGGTDKPLTVMPQPRAVVGLRGADMQSGEATLILEYDGAQPAEANQGMRRREDRGDWYVVTQHEPDGARRTVPSFDEPGYKVAWTVELTVPAGQAAFSNAPAEHEEVLADGRIHTKFRPTPPLPSYLLAIAVGPFEAVSAGTSRGGAPIRIIVPRGRSADAAFAAREVGPMLAALEDYTGIPYPYEKLDQIVVPGAPRGAMENAGLITYAPRLLLVPPTESAEVRRASIQVVAHELAHQWVGNLVTMAWWDDLWLNEAFAKWFEAVIVDAVHPELRGQLASVEDRHLALGADRLLSARRIRQPVTTEAEMGAAFDLITYQKGSRVIRMFESWLGPDVIRKGLRGYLERFAWKNATATDFLTALGEAAGRDVATPFTTFLDQPGVPAVDFELRCPKGGPATLALAQRRQLGGGAAPAAAGDARWQIPVCVRVPDGKTSARHCTLLTEATGELAVGSTCPAWVVPNAGGVGYYVSRPSPALRDALIAAWPRLDAAEQAALASDLTILLDSGDVDVGVVLALLPRLGASQASFLADRAVTWLDRAAPLIADADRPAFGRLVRATVGAAARRVGWTARKGEDFTDARMRPGLMGLITVDGGDRKAADQAVALTRKWLRDHGAVPTSLWAPVLSAAVRARPGAVFDFLVAAVDTEKDVAARRAILVALGTTRDPVRLVRAYGLLLSKSPLPLEYFYLLHPGASAGASSTASALSDGGTVATWNARFEFVRDHFDDLAGRFGVERTGALLVAPCDAARRDDAVAYLRSKLVPVPAVGESIVARAIETMDQCIARRAALVPPLTKALPRR